MGERSEQRSPMSGAEQAYQVVALLLSGMLFWGFVGWLLDHFLGTAFFLPVLLILGAAGGIYLVSKRFGGPTSDPNTPDGKDS